MNGRVKTILEVYNLSASKFADMLDIQASGVSHIISGRNKPSYDFIKKLLEVFPDINPDWLILGIGNMNRGVSSTIEIQEPNIHQTFVNTNNHVSDAIDNDQAKDITPNRPAGITVMEQSNPIASSTEYPSAAVSDISRDHDLKKVILLYSDKTFSVYMPENER